MSMKYIAVYLCSFVIGCGAPVMTSSMRTQLEKHHLQDEQRVVLVDYDQSIFSTRFFVVEPKTQTILYASKAGHARNSGLFYAREFSNTPGSEFSSLGVYGVGAEYSGKLGRSLKLHGLSKTNSNAFKRYIVLHRQPGWRLWSLGCVTVPTDETDAIIDLLKPGTKLVVYE